MLDFNHRPSFTERVSELIDQALCAEYKAQPERDYLGASRLGENCSRKLQYEYTNTPKDEGFSGQTLRIFAAGHVFEELAIRWLRLAGFELFTEKPNGYQFGFSVADGRIRGHVDGIIKAPRRFEWNSPGNLCQITRKIRNEEPEWTATRYCFLGWV